MSKKRTQARQKNRQQNKARKNKKRALQKKKRASAKNAQPSQQGDNNWVVPFVNEHACIYHGHENSDDHSLCGPQIFCCPNAARVLLSVHPNAIDSSAEWCDTTGEFLLEWDHPNLFYVWFCDPDDSDSIYFAGVEKDDLPGVLLGRRSIHDWINVSDRLTDPAIQTAE